ncbi:MAG: hypothetical protein FWC73_01875 [Defluviitaleaceae bacterium]|nr:hypothetical protein [Defluviitaleaceae bacterium]
MKKTSRSFIFRASLLVVFMMLISASMLFIFGGSGGCPIEARLATMNVTTITTTVSGARTVTNGNALVIRGAGRVTGNITVNAGGLLVVEGNPSPLAATNGYRAIQGRVILMGGDFYMLSGGLWNPANNTTPAVTVDRGGNFTMRGGIIRNNLTTNTAITSVATFAVDVIHGHYLLEDGMLVVGNGASAAFGNMLGVRLNQGGNGHFTMNGGTILTPGVNPTTISVAINAGTFTMNGGAIRGGDNRRGSGTGVAMRGIGSNQAHFIMNGGEIYSQSRGVDVEGHNAVFTLNDGQIRDNSGGSGTGVSLDREATFVMNGGAISNNRTANPGAGVRVSGNGTTFTMYGGSINRNRVVSAGTVATGGLIESSWSYNSRAGGVFVTNSGHFYMYGGYIEYNVAGTGGGVLLSSSASFNGMSVTQHRSYMKLDGGTIRNNEATFGHKELGGGGVKVYASAAATVPARNLSSLATFDMYSGYIIGNIASSRGGGSGNCPSGVMNFFGVSGGGVSVMTSRQTNGGIPTNPNAIFNMHGGTIANNRTSSGGIQNVMGGGVYASAIGAVINMYGGVMEGNSSVAGGAVAVNQGAVFNMHDGTIRNNEATGWALPDWPSNINFFRERGLVIRGGGGVYLHDYGRIIYSNFAPRFNMYGGYIVENTSLDGGGIFWMCVSHDTPFHINATTGIRQLEQAFTRVYISENAVVQYNTALRGAFIDDALWGRHRAEDPTVNWGGNVVTRTFTSTGGTYRHLFNNHDIRSRGGEAPEPEPEPTPTPVPVYDVTFVNTPQGYLNGAHGANVYLQLYYEDIVTDARVPSVDVIWGWEFTGWAYDAAGYFPADPASHVVAGDINFYAQFQRRYFRADFVTDGNGYIVDGPFYLYILFEDIITIDMMPPIIANQDFAFSHWAPDPVPGHLMMDHVTFTASFARTRVNLTFDVSPEHAGLVNWQPEFIQNVPVDVLFTAVPELFIDPDYVFVEWYPFDPMGYTPTAAEGDRTFTAVLARR